MIASGISNSLDTIPKLEDVALRVLISLEHTAPTRGAVVRKTARKRTDPATSLTHSAMLKTLKSRYVVTPAITEARRILRETLKSITAPYRFHAKYKAINTAGTPATREPIITPFIPSGGIRRKAKGTPNARVAIFSFINNFVSPNAVRRLDTLRFPKTVSKLAMTAKTRNGGA
jgi:hypothetical protein